MATQLTCDEGEELLALAALGVLSELEAGALDVHLRTCEHCRAVGRSFQQAAAALPTSLDELEAPPSLRRRLLKEVYASTPPHRRRRWWSSAWMRVPQSRALTVVGAAAAVAAVVLGAWGATRGAAPTKETYSVVATTSEPSARGTLTYYPATQEAVISVAGIPAPPSTAPDASSVYELWLIPHRGAPRPAGFLTQSPLTHTWTAAMHGDMSQVVTVAATTERSGGSPVPTGPQLFSVQLTG